LSFLLEYMPTFVANVQHMVETRNINSKTAVLLANLGTLEAPRRAEVARFLREFLSDPRPMGGAVSAWFNVQSIQRLHNFTRSAFLKGVRFENLTPVGTEGQICIKFVVE
jgi:hypothetical protein